MEDFEDFWQMLAVSARLGELVSGGQAAYTKMHEGSWVSHPLAFPTKARAAFNWRMMFVKAFGEDSLPRQFYLVPGRRHLNVWGTNETTMFEIYEQIIATRNWKRLKPQFGDTHGHCV